MANIFSNTVILQISEIILLTFLGFVLYQVINFKKIRRSDIEKKQAYTDQLTRKRK